MRRTGRLQLLGGMTVGAVSAGALIALFAVLVAGDGSVRPATPNPAGAAPTASVPSSAVATTTTLVTTTTPPEASSGLESAVSGRDGAAIYEAHCARCHDEGSKEEQGPDLRGLQLPIDDFAAVVLDGSGSMPGFEDISSAEIEAVAEWLRSGR